MTERIASARGPLILWFAAACEAMVVYANLRLENLFFAAHAAILGCVFAMIAWRGEPAWGTRRANVLWGLLALCGIFLGAAFFS